ncbi:DUF4142 domain-containing protein [Foetidibacter luteolus]|uniref:DUF4142 domain-containing protein n=1 Tax=Foetidibacter luteolus TaxID=2608880 RepID=UPI00129BE832|nr:DUF4142 domain-containing protein [Foetidibacter luteolus]
MKKISSFVLVAAVCLLQACGGGSSNPDSTDSAENINEQRDTGSLSDNDAANPGTGLPVDKDAADFAVKAASGSMMEVELGKLAEQKAVSERVKNFGAMMVQDHTAASDELKKIASAKNIALPAEMGDEHKKHIEDLSKKSGKDFDKAYVDLMLDDHKEDVEAFQKASNECKDPDVKNFATQTLPVLQKHLDSIKVIAGKK